MGDLFNLRNEAHWSFSSLNTYLNICSLRYAFEYIYKEEKEFIPSSLPFGRAFHQAMHDIAMNMAEKKDLSLREAQDKLSEFLLLEFASCINVKFKENEDINSLTELGRNMIEQMQKNWRNGDTVLKAGLSFKIELPSLSKPLIGEFDCLIKDSKDNIIVIDWKTSSSRWPEKKAEKDFQATCYLYAYKKLFKKIPLFRFDVITKNRNPSFTSYTTSRTENDFERLEMLAKLVEYGVSKEFFLPSETSFFCLECSHSKACQKWHKKRKFKKINFQHNAA